MVKNCRICGVEAYWRVEMDNGCACYPDDKSQWLCLQHISESEPIGSWNIIEGPDLITLFPVRTPAIKDDE